MLKLSEQSQAILEQLKITHQKGELQGVFRNIPNEVYHHPECPGVSKSNLDIIDDTYADYLHALESAKEEIKELDFKDKFFIGNAFHMITLEPHLFNDQFCLEPVAPKCDRRTKEGKAIYKEWQKNVLDPFELENQGKVRMPLGLWEELHVMRDACMSHPYLKELIENSEKEVTIFVKDEKTGLTLKCRLDMVNFDSNVICDLKSTLDASFLGFRRSVVKFKYDKQAAFYSDITRAATGQNFDFLFGACRKWTETEKNKPLDLRKPLFAQVFHAIPPVIEVGRALYRRNLDKISAVHKGEESPTYSQEIVPLDLPAYAFDISSR